MKSVLRSIRRALLPRGRFSSEDYWKRRYSTGGDSGPGSYRHLAEFKAKVLNEFVNANRIGSVIEFGCGDGNQLTLANYPAYVGYDISPLAVSTCRQLFKGDATREFYLASEYDGRSADLALSLDVVFHLTEDAVFERYMQTLFGAATSYVIIFSSNQDEQMEPASEHVRHRHFTRWIEREIPARWTLAQRIPNAYPYNGDYRSTSFADFYVYRTS